MLAKLHRLVNKKDFDVVYKKGRTLASPFFVVKYIENDLENSRVGIVISKKNLPKATDRNRAKRLTREAFTNIINEISKNIDIVIILNKKIAEKSYDEISQEIKKVFSKKGIIK